MLSLCLKFSGAWDLAEKALTHNPDERQEIAMISVSEAAKERIKSQIEGLSFDSISYCPAYSWVNKIIMDGVQVDGAGFHLTLFDLGKLEHVILVSIDDITVGFHPRSIFDGGNKRIGVSDGRLCIEDD
jgi:hypothetical protein